MANLENNLNSAENEFVSHAIDVKDFICERLAGDASSRRYYRIIHNAGTFVLMQWEPFKNTSEYPFLNTHSHFKKHNVLVPEVIATSPKLGLVLLEDLGDLTLERKFWENQSQDLALPFYKQAVDELIKIHYPATNDKNSQTLAFHISFDTEKLLWEMNYGLEHFIEKFCKIALSAKIKSELVHNFTNICSILNSEPKRLCHRDYHSRNIMLKLGQTRIIDFQDARMGAIQYDLVSLVHDSYVDINDALRSSIIEYYLSMARNTLGKPIDHSQFYSIFRLQMIQRCFKACGSFASFYNMREDRRYIKYLRPTIKKIASTLAQFPEYSVFYSVIIDNGLLDRDYLNSLVGGK